MATLDEAAHEDAASARPPSAVRLALSFILGGVAAVAAFALGLPGQGEFVASTWIAGFVAGLVAPGWAGFVALLTGITAFAIALDYSDGAFGLAWLIVLMLGALAAHAALTAAVLLRLRTLGWTGLKDLRVLGGVGAILALVQVFIWFAGDLARNPP